MSAGIEGPVLVQTGLAAVFFALVLAFGGHAHPFRALVRDRRTIVSFSAGMSVAYVFVHLMPELHGAREALTEVANLPLRFDGLAIYIVAMLGFIVFYGLDHLKVRLHRRHAMARAAGAAPGSAHKDAEHSLGRGAFWLHIVGFAAYVALMGCLAVRNLEGETGPVALFALAIGAHFLTIAHALQEEHGAVFQRIGRWLLAAMSLIGWLLGVLLTITPPVLAQLVAFISGAVIMNSAVMELPSEKDGRFVPFLAGGLLYALLLLPLG